MFKKHLPPPRDPPHPFRTLFISHNGGMAGAQQTLLTLLQGLNRHIISPYLFVPGRGELSKCAADANVPITVGNIIHWAPCVAEVRKENRQWHRRKMLASLRSRVHAIARLIDREGIDAVYSNTVTFVEGALAARMTGKPHVWHIHEPIYGNSELLPLIPRWLYMAGLRLLSTHVIFPSQALAREYPGLRTNHSVVHNGVKLPYPHDRISARTQVASRWNIDPSKNWVAVVGAIQPRKDHHTFLAAAQKVASKRPDVHFLIVGTGAEHYVRALEKQVAGFNLADKVTLTGWCDEPAMVLAAIDVLVISSEQESFGLTAIESMAVETPVVATRCGGPEEIIGNNRDGYFVDVKDAQEMASRILLLLEDPERRRRFGEAGRAKVLEKFTEERYVRSIENILVNAVSPP